MLWDNKTCMKIKTLTLMMKLTTWEIKEVFEIITRDIKGTILEIQVGTTPDTVSIIDHQIESKETGKIELGT